jgi:hypothetical protein
MSNEIRRLDLLLPDAYLGQRPGFQPPMSGAQLERNGVDYVRQNEIKGWVSLINPSCGSTDAALSRSPVGSRQLIVIRYLSQQSANGAGID